MTEWKKERLHVGLGPAELIEIDDYQFAAELTSRSDAIRELVEIALSGKFEKEHRSTIERMESKEAPAARTARLARYKRSSRKTRVHLALSESLRQGIDAYHKAARLGSRCECIRYLLSIALRGRFPQDHLDILADLTVGRWPLGYHDAADEIIRRPGDGPEIPNRSVPSVPARAPSS